MNGLEDAVKRHPRVGSSYSRVVVLMTALVVIGCGRIQLVSAYDDITDKSATDMQHKIDQFLLKMESQAGTPAGAYDTNAAVYDEFQSDADALRVRANAISNNRFTLTQIDALDSTLADLRKLHQREAGRGLRRDIAEPTRSAFNTIFTAIIRLELAKRRGQASTAP